MVKSTNKNEKAINGATFPKVSEMKQFNKKNQNDFNELLTQYDFSGKDLRFVKISSSKKRHNRFRG